MWLSSYAFHNSYINARTSLQKFSSRTMLYIRLFVGAVMITCVSTSTLLNNFQNSGAVEYNRKDKVQWQPDGSLVLSLLYKIPPLNDQTRRKLKNHTFDDCTAIKHLYPKSQTGLYTIHPIGGKELLVYCDMLTDGGGWTVFQRRFDGSVDFGHRKWLDFKNGFGKLDGEHWLGNEIVHQISSQGVYELRVELGDFDFHYRHAVYSNFKIGSESDGFRLTYDKFDHGTAGDSLKTAKNMKFTTMDKDQDTYNGGNCAGNPRNPGAWWHKECFEGRLTGAYYKSPKVSDWHGIIWNTWPGKNYSLKSTKMMMRRVLRSY